MLELSPEQKRILEWREVEKWTFPQIGAAIGAGAVTARTRFLKAVRHRDAWEDPEYEFRGLSTRAANALYYGYFRDGSVHSIRTKAELQRAVESGQIKKCTRIGKKLLAELVAWSGAKLPQKPPKPKRLCQHCGKEL
jgi:hypothetical protein